MLSAHSIDVPRVTGDPPQLGMAGGWDQAAVITELTVSPGESGEGLSAKPTEVRLLWDEETLYVRFLCEDDDIYLPVRGRDADLYLGDVVEVFLDAVGDGRQYFELQTNAAGDLFDQLITLTAPVIESQPNGRLLDVIVERDFWPVREWDMDGLHVAGRSVNGGWIGEFAIPARALLRRLGRERFQPGDRIRAHLIRYDYLPGEARRLVAMNWAPVYFGCPHISPAAMGELRLSEPLLPE